MSIKIQKIDSIKSHPNADRLEVAVIGGWETCVTKNMFHAGDLVIYIPPDSLVPKKLHEFLGITHHCGKLPTLSEEAIAGFRRVRGTSLRGYKSFGTLMTIKDFCEFISNENVDVTDLLGIKKWKPKEKLFLGEAAKPVPLFHKYTDIQNIRNYPGLFKQGEKVVITEKIHGTNCRIGLCEAGSWMAGSHTIQRKEFDAGGHKSKYWIPLDNNQIRGMITELADANSNYLSLIVFGEIYGSGIQDMDYGCINNIEFRVFDIAVNGNYMDWKDVVSICDHWNVVTVPELYNGPYSSKIVEELTDGPTTLASPDKIRCAYKGREGIVVKTLVERFEPILNDRMILKSVSVDYLSRKNPVDES